ncbi:MAG: nucleotidyltransferase family protein [Thermodesulfobacteriota bacterium]|nr:nucleotidyltransferase family protein [Thermodesulfobacteriota bacterium]
MKKDEILKILEGVKKDVRQRYKAEIKGIFGSYARGEEKEGSDIDVLVSFLEDATLFDLVRLGDFLEERLHCRVDIVSQRSIRKEIEPYIYGDLARL